MAIAEDVIQEQLYPKNPSTGESFRLGIAQFKYKVIWSLREAMAPLPEHRKRPKSERTAAKSKAAGVGK